MKKTKIMTAIAQTIFLCFCCIFDSRAQVQEIQQLVLNIEKLTQLKGILRDMQMGYRIYQQGYSSISSLSQGNFDLHSTFLNGLWMVSPAVRNYGKVAEIISQEAALFKEYRGELSRFRQDGVFNPGELNYISNVYNSLIKQSLADLDELTNLLASGRLRMSDAERIKAIDHICSAGNDKLQFLRHFNSQGMILAFQRHKERMETQSIRQFYSLKN